MKDPTKPAPAPSAPEVYRRRPVVLSRVGEAPAPDRASPDLDERTREIDEPAEDKTP